MVYNGRFNIERIVEENPRPHLFEEPKEIPSGELSLSEYVFYMGLRDEIQKSYRKPIGEKFPRENPTKEHYTNLQSFSDKFFF